MAFFDSTAQNLDYVSAYTFEPSKAARNTQFYEIEPAIVSEINVDGEIGKINAYALFSKKFVTMYPLSQNIKIFPLPGEIVTFTSHKLKRNSINVNTFYQYVPWRNKSHLNDQGFHDSIKQAIEQRNTQPIDLNTVKGAPNTYNISNQKYPGKYFTYNSLFDKTLVMFEGDVVFEGRNNQTIRFGNAIPKNISFSETPFADLIFKSSWIYSKSDTRGGNPYIIFSTNKSNLNGEYKLEDIQNDQTTFILSSGGESGINIPLSLSAIKNKPVSFDIPNTYNMDLALLNSGQIVLNAKTDSIFLSSNFDILGISNRTISFKTTNKFELHGKLINLGENAKAEGQAVVKSNDLMNFLSEMIDAILSLKYDNLGSVIPGTDFRLKLLKQRLTTASNERNAPVFSSRITYTL